MSAPALADVSPRQLPVSSGRLTVSGSNFTALAPQVVGVWLGDVACIGVLTNATHVQCAAPAGLGGDRPVSVRAPGGVDVWAPHDVSYEPPAIIFVAAKTGDTDVDGKLVLLPSQGAPSGTDLSTSGQAIHVICTACGSSVSDVSGVWVGGIACGEVAHDGAGAISCSLLPAQHAQLQLLSNGTTAQPTNAGIEVPIFICVAGQCSALVALPVMGKPVLTSVSLPTTGDGHRLVSGGDVVTVDGYHLGRSQADVSAVTVGGVGCAYEWLASKLIVTMPPAPAGPSQAAELLLIRITTRAGWTSPAMPAISVTYRTPYQQARAPSVVAHLAAIHRPNTAPRAWQMYVDVPVSVSLSLVPPHAVSVQWRASAFSMWESSIEVVIGVDSEVGKLHMAGVNSTSDIPFCTTEVHLAGTVSHAQLPPTAVKVRVSLVSAGGTGPWPDTGAWVPAALPEHGIQALIGMRGGADSSTVELSMDVLDSSQLAAVPVTQFQVRYATLGTPRAAGVDVSAYTSAGSGSGNSQRSRDVQAVKATNATTATAALLAAIRAHGCSTILTAGTIPTIALASAHITRYTAVIERVPLSPVIFTATLITAAGELPANVASPLLYDSCTPAQYLRTQVEATSPDAAMCVPCPAGAWCGGGRYDTIMPLAGWYRIGWTADALSLSLCSVLAACPGVPVAAASAVGSNRTAAAAALTAQYVSQLGAYGQVGSTASQDCAAGYTGTLFAECVVGYSQSSIDGSCRPCRAAGVQVLLLLLGLCVIAAGLNYLIISTIPTGLGDDRMLTSALKKLILSHNQQIGLAIGFRFAWPAAVGGMLDVTDTVSNMGDSALATDCMVSEQGHGGFRLRKVAVVLAPWVLLLIACAVWLGLHARARHIQRNCPHSSSPSASPLQPSRQLRPQSISSSHSTAAISSTLPATSISVAHLVHWRYVKQYMTMTVVILCFAPRTSVTKASLRQVSCVTLANDPTGRQVLADDYDVPCNSAENATWIYSLGVPGFVLYGLGMPGFLWVLL